MRHVGAVSFAALAACCVVPFAASSAHAGGIVAHWTFDQIGGATATDSVGTFNGTLQGSASMVAGGVSGGAVQISSAGNGLVNMGNVLSLTGQQACTITAWVKLAPGSTGSMLAVGKHQAGFLNGYFLGIGTSGSCYGQTGKAWLYRSMICGQEPIAVTPVNDGAWHFIAATFHSTTGCRMYVDGAPLEAVTGPIAVLANTAAFLIGGVEFSGVPTSVFDGMIDDVQIYERALLCRDIEAMYQNPSTEAPVITPDLNGDGEVDGTDLGLLLGAWGTPATDLNSDGDTDGTDLGILLGAWGSC
ncbi:MAG: LamG-like jellyroll fold domain-containing protein [Phycisphaerales bacterium]